MREASATGELRLADLRRRWEDDPSSRLFLQLAEEYRRMGRSEEAAEVLRQGLERNPQYLSAQVALGRCLLDLGRPQAALSTLEQVLERDTTQLVAGKLLVEAHVQRGDALRARRQLDLYSSLNPKDPEIEALRERIEALVLADAEPEPAPRGYAEPEVLPGRAETTPVAAAEAPPASTAPPEAAPGIVAGSPPATGRPAAPRTEVPSTGGEAWPPEPTAEPGSRNGRALGAVPAGEPFPALPGRVSRRRFYAGLCQEGLFPLGAAPAAAPFEAPPAPAGDLAAEPGLAPAGAKSALPAAALAVDGAEPWAEVAEPGPAAEAWTPEVAPAASPAEPWAVAEVAPEPPAWAAAEPAPARPSWAAEEPAFAPAAGPQPALKPPPSLPGAPEEDETLPFGVAPGRRPPAEPAAEPVEEPPATATLGELYLKQGHHGEAERIFRAVLAQEPDNAAARAGLAVLAGLRSPAAAGGDGSRAGAGEPNPIERKMRLLRRFLAVVQSAAERDVS